MMTSEMSSGNLMADKRAEYARMLVESGDFQAATELMQQALELAPGWTAGWFQAGGYFEKAGDKEQASKAFELVLRTSATDIFGARLKLAHLQGQSVDAPQTAYVEALFDEYAAKFDTSLVEKLGYRVPELLSEMVGRNMPGRSFGRCVDLGCGTGLMVQALGAKADQSIGIDLSAAMLAKAEAKGLYTRLIKADLIDGMVEAGPADLVIAADVFMYLGSLGPVFATAAANLLPDGLFAFSVELSKGNGDYELRPSMRHAHSAEYVTTCLATNGLESLETKTAIIRMDGDSPIEGLLTVAGKSANT